MPNGKILTCSQCGHWYEIQHTWTDEHSGLIYCSGCANEFDKIAFGVVQDEKLLEEESK